MMETSTKNHMSKMGIGDAQLVQQRLVGALDGEPGGID
jgi:hypothetical protein